MIYLLAINRCIFEGDLFNSYLAAIKFMESSNEFGEDDISKIGLLLEENAKMSRVEDTRVASEVIAKQIVIQTDVHLRRNVTSQG